MPAVPGTLALEFTCAYAVGDGVGPAPSDQHENDNQEQDQYMARCVVNDSLSSDEEVHGWLLFAAFIGHWHTGNVQTISLLPACVNATAEDRLQTVLDLIQRWDELSWPLHPAR